MMLLQQAMLHITLRNNTDLIRDRRGCDGSWIYSYLFNQYLSPLKLWVRIPFMVRCTQKQHYVIKFVSDLRQVGGFLRDWETEGSLVSSTNKTVRHDITEMYEVFLKMVFIP
jgi:hypothetical protein